MVLHAPNIPFVLFMYVTLNCVGHCIFYNGIYMYTLIVPFWYALAAYHENFVNPHGLYFGKRYLNQNINDKTSETDIPPKCTKKV